MDTDRKAWGKTLRPMSKKKLESGTRFGLKRTPLKRQGKQAKQDKINLAQCKEKADGLCEICGCIGSDHHHLLKRSLYPEYKNEPCNHIFLCRRCHRIAHDEPVSVPKILRDAIKEKIQKRLEIVKKELGL